MTRALVTAAFALPLLFALLISAARAGQPSSSQIEALLSELDTCPTACLLGIQPGTTHLNDVTALLRATGWVKDIRFARAMELTSGYMQWAWNGSEPDYVNPRREGGMWIEEGIVRYISVVTTIPYGEWWLRLGEPRLALRGVIYGETMRLNGISLFDGEDFQIRFETACPAQAGSFWHAQTMVVIGVQSETAPFETRTPPGWLPLWGRCGWRR